MIPSAALVLINLVAHFIPFERAALSLDDLARLLSVQWSWDFFLNEMRDPNRPLNAFHYLIVSAAAIHPMFPVLFSFFSSAGVTVAVYWLLQRLLKNPPAAFVGALFYNLMPNKLALYHTLEYTSTHVALLLYLSSFILFIRYLERGGAAALWGSVASYTVALFSYMLGFLLPVALLSYALLVRSRRAGSVAAFLIPAAAYMAWRSNLFGIVPVEEIACQVVQIPQIAVNLFKMVPNLYVGRQMAKAVLYGLVRFFSIPMPGWPLLLAVNVAVVWGLLRWLRQARFAPVRVGMLGLGLLMFLALLTPALLTWGVMDRHTSLSSIGLVLLVLVGISRLNSVLQRCLIGLGVTAGLIISQGTAWNQVVACRMNRAIAQTLQQHREEVLTADRVLIDQYSFSQRIPHTWVEDPNNQLDTYWGVQALLGRGNPFLVHWAVGERKQVLVVRSPVRVEGGEIRFQVYNPDIYRLEEIAVPAQGSILIDYEAVYPKGFQDGNRAGASR